MILLVVITQKVTGCKGTWSEAYSTWLQPALHRCYWATQALFKGAVSPIFSITAKRAKRCWHVNNWNSKINGPVLLKWLFYHKGTINECALMWMARMEMDSNLKTCCRFFQVFTLMSPLKLVKKWFWLTKKSSFQKYTHPDNHTWQITYHYQMSRS